MEKRYQKNFEVIKGKKDLSGSKLVFEDKGAEKGFSFLVLYPQKPSEDDNFKFQYEQPLTLKVGEADLIALTAAFNNVIKGSELVKLYHQGQKNDIEWNITVKVMKNDYGFNISFGKKVGSELKRLTCQLTPAEAFTFGIILKKATENLYS